MIDIPESEPAVKAVSEAMAGHEAASKASTEADESDNPFAFVPITDANRPRQRLKKPEAPTSRWPERSWAILRVGLLLQGVVLTIFMAAVATMTAMLTPVVIAAVEQSLIPGNPPPNFNPSQTIPVLDLILNGCILLLFVSHALCCLSPPETGVGHIAGKNLMADLSVPVLGIGLMLFPTLSDAGIILALVGLVAVWGFVQQAIGCWFLVGCADFTKNERILNRAVLAHSLSIPVAFFAGFGLTILFSAGSIPTWLGWVMLVSVVLLLLAEFLILLVMISVSLELAWILPPEAIDDRL